MYAFPVVPGIQGPTNIESECLKYFFCSMCFVSEVTSLATKGNSFSHSLCTIRYLV